MLCSGKCSGTDVARRQGASAVASNLSVLGSADANAELWNATVTLNNSTVAEVRCKVA